MEQLIELVTENHQLNCNTIHLLIRQLADTLSTFTHSPADFGSAGELQLTGND
jgi:hypothetical protein